MMWQEFEQMTGKAIPYADYLRVECLYMFFDHLTKEDMFDIHKNLGMDLIIKMALDIDDTIRTYSKKLSACQAHNAAQGTYLQELKNRNEELETQLMQYKAYVSGIVKAVGKGV